jgi:lipopolysaccharide/colanic/teichoic acid biosynthesis glycosyltransferase
VCIKRKEQMTIMKIFLTVKINNNFQIVSFRFFLSMVCSYFAIILISPVSISVETERLRDNDKTKILEKFKMMKKKTKKKENNFTVWRKN